MYERARLEKGTKNMAAQVFLVIVNIMQKHTV